METDFTYWPHSTPIGVKVEEVFGEVFSSGKLWDEMALQIFCEHGADSFREIGHFPDGAPYISGLPARISLTHTKGLLAVAFLPKTPEADLALFNPRTSMGIDAERIDREQVLKIREKFLSEEELGIVNDKDILKNIIAWTSKEALYKAALTPGIDFRNSLKIEKLPVFFRDGDFRKFKEEDYGKAIMTDISGQEGKAFEMTLFSYESAGCCITIAASVKCAKYH